MLAELAAANAAYAVIKEAISNGGDLIAAGAKLGEYFGLKSEISKRASKKGNSSHCLCDVYRSVGDASKGIINPI